jgi:hypothetical protein
MNKTTSTAVLIAWVLLANGANARAQDSSKVFIDVNIGAQTQSRTLDTSTSFPLYGETAVVNTAQGINGGPLFDFSGGYRVMPAFAVGVGFSVFSKSGDGSLIALIPDPFIRNRPATVSASTSGLTHRELATHVIAVWSVPVSRRMDATIFGGPSFFRLSQDVMTATVPAGTQNVSTSNESQKGNAVGGNVGVNFNYMFAPRYGVGIVLRYAGASVDLPSAENVGVGGFQAGGGLRLKF